MKRYSLILSILFLFTASVASAQSPTRFLSIPSSAFTPVNSEDSYTGNFSGTARFITGAGNTMFAPVNLPHDATITSLLCGGFDPSTDVRLRFTLRRNEPQQANIDMAVVESTFPDVGFKFLSTSSISSPFVNNGRFNYYIVFEAPAFDVGICTGCSVNYCRIGYTVDQ